MSPVIVNERHYTGPNDSLRFAYSEAEIKAAVSANLATLEAFIDQQTKKALAAAKDSGAKDTTIEKLIALAESGFSNGAPLKYEAELALYYATLVRIARQRQSFLKIVQEHAVYTSRTDDGRAVLAAGELEVLVLPINVRNFGTHSHRPIRGHGLSAMGVRSFRGLDAQVPSSFMEPAPIVEPETDLETLLREGTD